MPLAARCATDRRATARSIALNSAAGGNWANKGKCIWARAAGEIVAADATTPARLADADRQSLPVGGRFCSCFI